jgi:hypothetical protein
VFFKHKGHTGLHKEAVSQALIDFGRPNIILKKATTHQMTLSHQMSSGFFQNNILRYRESA